MAFAPIAYIIPEYDKSKFKNWWLKAYDPGTLNPKSMATDGAGSGEVSRFELNSEGFPITAGNALVIPFVESPYDMWLFPTAAEADSNDTSNALQFADNLSSSVISEQAHAGDSKLAGGNIHPVDRTANSSLNDPIPSGTLFLVINGTQYRLSDTIPSTANLDSFTESEYVCVIGGTTYYLLPDLEGDIDLSKYTLLDTTGATDETVALKNIAIAADGRHVYDFSGSLQISETIHFDKPKTFDFGDVEFLVDLDTATLTDGEVILIGTRDVTLAHTTTSEITEGDTDIGTISGITEGDVICLWNPVDASWSGYNAEYRQGEYQFVRSIAPVVMDGSAMDTYPVGTEIYVLDQRQIPVTGKVKVTNTGSYGTLLGVVIGNNNSSDITGLKASIEQGTHALTFARGLNLTGGSMIANQKSSAVSGLNYGLAYTACQNCKFDGEFHAERHGSTTGSSGRSAEAVNRDCLTTGRITTTGQGNVQAADMHGASERCGIGGFAMGYTPRGHDSYVLPGTKIVSPKSGIVPVQYSEMKSMKHSLKGAEVTMIGTSSRGIIDAGGQSASFDANCVIGGILDWTDMKVNGADHANWIYAARNRGATIDWAVDLDNSIANVPSATTSILSNAVSGSNPDWLNFSTLLWTVPVVANAVTSLRGIELTGTATITVTTASTVFSEPVAFGVTMPRSPYVVPIDSKGFFTTSLPVVKPTSVTTSGFSASAFNAKGINFESGGTVDVIWKAESL